MEQIYLPQNYDWEFTIKCTKCYNTHQNSIYLNRNEELEGKKQKGICHFMMKCKECNCEVTIHILEDEYKVIKIEDEKGKGIIAQFDFRGCEPEKWIPKLIFGESLSGQIFQEIDISDLWVDYDEKFQEQVEVETKWEFVKIK